MTTAEQFFTSRPVWDPQNYVIQTCPVRGPRIVVCHRHPIPGRGAVCYRRDHISSEKTTALITRNMHRLEPDSRHRYKCTLWHPDYYNRQMFQISVNLNTVNRAACQSL